MSIIISDTYKGRSKDPTVNAGLVVVGVSTFNSTVTIGGTLTYEDVTNIDSVGLITARTGVVVTAGGVRVVSGGATIIGVVTATSFTGSASGLTNVPSAQLTGALPALDGSALTDLNIPAGFTELDAALFN
jgi:hypothetical protein